MEGLAAQTRHTSSGEALAWHIYLILQRLEEKTGYRFPRRILEASVENNMLYIRFARPKTREADVEPLPLATPVFLFHDEETGEPTALEALDLEELLRELSILPKTARKPGTARAL